MTSDLSPEKVRTLIEQAIEWTRLGHHDGYRLWHNGAIEGTTLTDADLARVDARLPHAIKAMFDQRPMDAHPDVGGLRFAQLLDFYTRPLRWTEPNDTVVAILPDTYVERVTEHEVQLVGYFYPLRETQVVAPPFEYPLTVPYFGSNHAFRLRIMRDALEQQYPGSLARLEVAQTLGLSPTECVTALFESTPAIAPIALGNDLTA